MTHPSYLAPRGVTFDADDHHIKHLTFSLDQVVLNGDECVSINFFGIKNDTDRSGFEITVSGTNDPGSYPVGAVKACIEATAMNRELCSDNLCLLHCESHSKSILSEAIELAGLGDKGFTPRSFRPTGATASSAIAANTKPEIAMLIGRWITDRVFREIYVYRLVHDSYTRDIFQFEGIHDDTQKTCNVPYGELFHLAVSIHEQFIFLRNYILGVVGTIPVILVNFSHFS